MSGSIKQEGISRSKLDLKPSKDNIVGSKNIRFNHRANLGDTSFDLINLTNGIAGFVNPNAGDVTSAYAFKKNLRIYSSLDYELIPEKDYQINGTTITFINDMASAGAQQDEIFVGEFHAPAENTIVADAQQRRFDYVLAQGVTTLSLGNSYRVGENEIFVYRNGKLQVVGVDPDGNYVEVDDGNGYGTSIQFNTANGSSDDSIAVVFGLTFAGDISIFSDLERLSGAILELAKDLSLASEKPVGDYISATPSEVERNTFGNQVLDHESRLDTFVNQQYTEAEQDTGKKWIDGRTIYRIVHEVATDVTTTGTTIVTWPTNLEPINAQSWNTDSRWELGWRGLSPDFRSIIYDASNGSVVVFLTNWRVRAGEKIVMEYVKP